MKDKKILIAIIVLIIVIIGIIGIIGLLKLQNNNSNKYDWTSEDTIIAINEIKEVGNYTEFYTVENLINKYISNCSLEINENEKKQYIYNILNKDYIQKNNINFNNIYQYVNELNGEYTFYALKVENIMRDATIKDYVVYGKIHNLRDNSYKNAYYCVNVDETNVTFSLNEIDKEKYENRKAMELDSNISTIEENENNTYFFSSMSKAKIADMQINKYTILSINYPEEAYELLDDEFKQRKFGNVNNFKEYIEKNKENINNIMISKYSQKDMDNGETMYIYIDTYDNYYIFKETSPMNYKLILDTYTLDLDEFVEKYNKVNDQNKVALNLERVKQAINCKDYNYVYSKLDDSFKNNYFKTIEEFEKYMENTFFNINKFDYNNFESSGRINSYKVEISDYEGNSSETFTKIFIMELKEGTDFVMSFNVN